ncbi:MAG TPA: 2'-5' RNA ligase family protein [Acidimicrobiales bacterium]
MRLFVAVRPPEDVLDALAALRRPGRPGVRWTTRPQWHVTLRFLGEVDDAGPVVAALDAAPLAPCTAVAGPAVARLGRSVVMVPVAGVEALAAAVTAATADLGVPPAARPFDGHVTIARVRRGSLRDLVGEPIDLRFRVTDVRLVRSRPGPDGQRYDDLHVRPLA